MPDRIETYCDGHLIKQIAQVDVGPTADKPFHEFVDGSYRWFVGDCEVPEKIARALLRGWEPVTDGPS